MKILFSGGVSLRYKERVTKKKKYRSFKEFVDFKKKVDRIFKEYDIKLKTIPQDPTPIIDIVDYNFIVEYRSDKYYRLIEKIKELSLLKDLAYHLEFEFTEKEIKESPLFCMATYYDFYGTSIKHPSEYGTKYEKVFVCPKCGTTRFRQISALYWNTNQMKKKLLIEIPSHRRKGGYAFIISERLANVFKSQNFTGYTLEPVVHVGRKEEREKHYQMIITNKLPPISDKMPTLEDDINMEQKYRCKDCAKAVIKFPLHYDRSSLNNICDFNVAYEERVYPDFQPRVLVSPRVKELFNLLRIKPAYKPIIVVD